MHLFTFVVDKEGGTYVSQHSGKDLRQAVDELCSFAADVDDLPLDGNDCIAITGSVEDAVLLNGMTNV